MAQRRRWSSCRCRIATPHGPARFASYPTTVAVGPSTRDVDIGRGIYRRHQKCREQAGGCQGHRCRQGQCGSCGSRECPSSHPGTLSTTVINGQNCQRGGRRPIIVSGQRCRDLSLDHIRRRAVLVVFAYVGFHLELCHGAFVSSVDTSGSESSDNWCSWTKAQQ